MTQRVNIQGIEGLGPQAGPCGSVGADCLRERWALALCVNLTALEAFFQGFGETRFLVGLRKQTRAAEALCGSLVRHGQGYQYAVAAGRSAGEAAREEQLPVEGVAQWWADAVRVSFALGAVDNGLHDPEAQDVAKSVHRGCRAAVRLLYSDPVADALLCRATGEDAGDFLTELADHLVTSGFSF